MKIIFLDIDGVLNSQLFYTSGRADKIGLGRRSNIDPVAVGYLNDLIRNTDAKVVVTSTWRLGRTTDELQSILEESGFVGEVIDRTIDMRRGDDGDCILRGNEILQWMKAHPAELGCGYSDYRHYVIFDDDSDMLYWQRNNLILTDQHCGLTPNSVYKAQRILNS